MQSVPITTNVMSSNPGQARVCSIQYYVIKFVSDLRQVGGFLRVLRFPSPIKLTATIYITEIVLKVALNTINHKPQPLLFNYHLCTSWVQFGLWYLRLCFSIDIFSIVLFQNFSWCGGYSLISDEYKNKFDEDHPMLI